MGYDTLREYAGRRRLTPLIARDGVHRFYREVVSNTVPW